MNRLFDEIEAVEDEVLKISIDTDKEKNLKELTKLYRKVINIREEFLEYCFSQHSLEELEQLRFLVQEQLLNLKIMIKECRNINYKNEEEAIYRLYRRQVSN